MNIDELFQDPEYGNFVCVYLGLAFVGQILEPYTRNGLRRVHHKIKTTLAGKLPCAGNCGNDPSKWCETCKEWQKELQKYNRFVDWRLQESSKWPQSYEHIIGIFCNTPGGNIYDLSNECGIWKRCNEFKIDKLTVKRVKGCRGKYFAHNNTLRVSDHDKARVFDALKDLLSDRDVGRYIINKQDCLNELKEIQNCTYLEKAIEREIRNICNNSDETSKRLRQITVTGVENSKVLDDINQRLRTLDERQEHNHREVIDRLDFVIMLLLRLLSIYNILTAVTANITGKVAKIREKLYNCPLYGFHAVIIITACFLMRLLFTYLSNVSESELSYMSSRRNANNGSNPYSGCLSESHYPFSLDVRLLGLLHTENKLIGREWVYDELEQNIFQQNTNFRGTLVIAEPGFGKSAIVAHLLSVGENEKGWKLRQHTVAFHVCKFNNYTTKNPVQLIKRLIWFLSIKSAQYWQYIERLENSIIADDEKCEKDIQICFDLAITNPLNKLTIPHDAPWIVVIDALDECMENDGRNRILELLSNRLIFMQQKGRKWFKWIITSRNMAYLTYLRKLDTVNFPSEDKRNHGDIRQFVVQQLM